MTRPESGECSGQDNVPAEVRQIAADLVIEKPIALVGLMGAGKTTVGRRLAQALNIDFVDADVEIAQAAGMPIPEIFATHGEADFRRGERSVIARLLGNAPFVLATGGGAYMDAETRALMREKAISIWLKAPLDVLLKRVDRRDDRPLLKTDDPRVVMERLMAQRYPIYAEADIIVETGNAPHMAAVAAVLDALRAYLTK